MQKEQNKILFDFKSRIITDPKLIVKYDKESDYQYYIPLAEKASLDQNAINSHAFTNASKELGIEYQPLLIAVNEDDEFKDTKDSPFRIHLRVWQGKHRYLDSISLKQRWHVKYVKFDSFEEFIKTRPLLEERKDTDILGNNVRSRQIQDDVISTANKLWVVDGITPKSTICMKLIEILGHGKPYSESTIRRYCPQEFKDERRSKNRSMSVNKTSKKSKKDIIIEQKEKENTFLIEQISIYKGREKPESEKDRDIMFLLSDKKKLQLDKTRLIEEISKMICSKCRRPVKKHGLLSDKYKDSNIHGYAINEVCDYAE